jgi:hypothetical protein
MNTDLVSIQDLTQESHVLKTNFKEEGSDLAHSTVTLPSNGILCYKQLYHLAVSPETM